MEIICSILIIIMAGILYCKKSIKIENISSTEKLLLAPKDTHKMSNMCIKPNSKPLIQKDFLHMFALRFQKSNPYNKNLKLTLKDMYTMYLQFNSDLLLPLAPYHYLNFCKEIKKEFDFVMVRINNKRVAELHGYQYVYKEK